MNERHDPNVTKDIPSAPADSASEDARPTLTDAVDHLLTADRAPRGATPGTDHAPGLASGGFRADGTTGPFVPGPDAAPAGTLPELASVSVPGYAIESVLGHGGMGVVYKARHLTLKRTVALKMVLAGGHAGPHELARFRIEAEAVARLQHPNIVQIHEVGDADGHPYCALEFVEGGNLADKLHGKPMPVREAAKLVEALAWAMQLAHSRNVVHRDLKPANILLASPGRDSVELIPKITDFGLARQLDSDSGATQAGAVMGTPSYMAPEQASGRAHEAGPAADIYALGAILYACLAGRPPFKGQTVVETLDQVRTQEPEPPSRWQTGVPPDLDTICLKCLRKEPEKRYSSAAALADELVRYQQGRPILARPAGHIERAVKWVRRNPVVAGATVAVVLALAAGTTVSYLKYRETDRALGERNTALGAAKAALGKANDERERADREARQATREKEVATEQRDRAELLVHAGKLAQAQLMWKDEKPVEALGFLDECQWNLRGWEHRHLWTLYQSNQATFRGHTAGVAGVAWSPDGKRLVSRSNDTTLKVWDADTGQELLSLIGHTCGVAWSPDGKRLLSGLADNTLRVWDADRGQALLSLKGHTRAVTSMAWSPDGKRILSGSWDNTLKVWDADRGQALRTLKGHTREVTGVAWSPDGKRLLSASADNTLQVWDADTGQALLSLKGLLGVAPSVAWSPDGQRFLSASWDTLDVWSADKGQILLTLKGHTGAVTSLAWSPDGKRFLSGSNDNTLKVWDADQGQALRTLKGHAGAVASVAWSPDGKRIVSGSWDRTLKVWDADKGQEILSPRGHLMFVQSVAWSPDGKRFLSGSADNTLKVWDAGTGQELLTLRGHTREVACVAWSPDGKRLVSGSGDNTLQVWDADTGQALFTSKGHTGAVNSVAWSPDGKRLLTGSDDRTLKVWDADQGRELLTLRGHTGAVASVAWSPHGKRILSGSGDRTLKVWGADQGQELLSVKGHTGAVTSVAWSPHGKRILSGSVDNALKVWDAGTGQELLSLKGHTGVVASVAWSPDGKRLVSGSDDRTLKVWDADKGQELLSLKGHSGRVVSVAWSPDGKHLLSGSLDNTLKWDNMLKVWDADQGQALLSLKGHTGQVQSVAFSLDGKYVSGKDDSGKVLTWNTLTGQLLPAADPVPQERKAQATSPDGSLRAFTENGQLKVLRLPDFIEAQKRERLFLERLARSVPGYHYEKAELYAKSGDHFAGAFHLRRLLALRPGYAVLLLRREPFNQREDSGALGVAALDAAIVQEPKNAVLWLRRGLLRSRQGIQEAQADLDRAIELGRADAAVLLARALLEARAGRPGQARSLQAQALGQTALPVLDAGRGWERRPRTAPLPQGPATDAADTVLALEEELGWERRAGPLQAASAFAASGSVSGPWPAALTLALGPRSVQETAPAWRWCGLARCARGEWDRAIHDLDAALLLSPDDLVARRCRARAHAELLQWDMARADCTTCLKARPDDWELWYLRALGCREMNRPDLAVSDLTRALAQGNDGRALREALPDYCLKAAQFAYDQKRFAAAMRLWAEALVSDPKLGDDRQARHRYNAARAAALAGAGQGKDEPPLDEAAKSRLRRQALDWLQAELEAWTKLLESGPPEDGRTVVQTMSHWQHDNDLAGIRDAAALARLPVDEQKVFTQLWTDVAALLRKAEKEPK